MWPSWHWNVGGYSFAFNVFLPALLPLGLIMTGLGWGKMRTAATLAWVG